MRCNCICAQHISIIIQHSYILSLAILVVLYSYKSTALIRLENVSLLWIMNKRSYRFWFHAAHPFCIYAAVRLVTCYAGYILYIQSRHIIIFNHECANEMYISLYIADRNELVLFFNESDWKVCNLTVNLFSRIIKKLNNVHFTLNILWYYELCIDFLMGEWSFMSL